MLSFLAKKDKIKTSTFICQKVPPKYWTFFANHITRMTEIIIMSLFTNSSRQLRRITEQCWKCPRTATPSSTCHSCHQKAKHIMVYMKSTQAFSHFECNTQLVVFIFNKQQTVCLLPDKSTFHSRQRIHFTVNTKSKNTNNNVFILE